MQMSFHNFSSFIRHLLGTALCQALTGLRSKNTAVNWADICPQSESETDTEEVSVNVKNIVLEKEQGR